MLSPVVVDRFLRRSGSRVSILMACRRKVPTAHCPRGYRDYTEAESKKTENLVCRASAQFYFCEFRGKELFNSHRPLRSLRGFEPNRDLTTLRMPSDGTRMVSSEKCPETNSDVGFDGRLPRLVCIVLSI